MIGKGTNMSSAELKRDPFLDPDEKTLPKEEVEFILIGAGACLFPEHKLVV